MHTQGSAYTRQCTHKAVHKQGDAHKRRFVATAGVLLFKGGCRGWPLRPAKLAEAREVLAVHTQGGAHIRWCTHKAVHTQGDAHKRRFVATAAVSSFKVGCGGMDPASGEASRGKGRFGGSHTRRCTHRAVHTQGGAHKRRFVATTSLLLCKWARSGWPPRRAKRDYAREGLAVHTQGGAHTRRCTQKVVCSHHRSFVM